MSLEVCLYTCITNTSTVTYTHKYTHVCTEHTYLGGHANMRAHTNLYTYIRRHIHTHACAHTTPWDQVLVRGSLKRQCFGHLMQRADSLKKTLMLGRLKAEEEGSRGWDGWVASPTQRTWVWVTLGVGDRQGGLVCCSPWGSQRVGHDWTTELNYTCICITESYICMLLRY